MLFELQAVKNVANIVDFRVPKPQQICSTAKSAAKHAKNMHLICIESQQYCFDLVRKLLIAKCWLVSFTYSHSACVVLCLKAPRETAYVLNHWLAGWQFLKLYDL